VRDTDPHIHVDVKLGGDVAARDILASTFGLAADAPATVATGCGAQVPLAMTSTRPERVTCLPCREFAHGQHLRLADQVDRLARMPGSVITPEQATTAVRLHRELAGRFGGPAR
jgi:hypothetical protein